jgi:hypothetical protein
MSTTLILLPSKEVNLKNLPIAMEGGPIQYKKLIILKQTIMGVDSCDQGSRFNSFKIIIN